MVYGAIYRLLARPLRLGAGKLLSDAPHGVLSQTVVLAMLFLSTFGFQHLFQMSESRATAVWMDLLVCGMLLGIQYTSYLAIIAGRKAQLTESMLTDASAHWELSQALLSRLGSFMHDVWHIVLGVKVAKVPGLKGYLDPHREPARRLPIHVLLEQRRAQLRPRRRSSSLREQGHTNDGLR